MIVPSILNANNLKLYEAVEKAKSAGITRFHIDIMDGHFVPNLSFGPQLVHDLKQEFSDLEIEVHLMSNNLKVFVPVFVNAGADIIEIHYEATNDAELKKWLNYIQDSQKKAGLVLNPDTSVDVLRNYTSVLDQVLFMSVFPGFGGQKFISKTIERINQAKRILDDNINIEVDGGINDKNIVQVQKAGAKLFVVGSYIFNNKNINKTIIDLSKILES